MPIPPTNTTPATAFDLAGELPFNDTIDLRALANPQKVWFKFTLNGEFGFSIWASPDNAGVAHYKPRYKYYFGLPADPAVGILQNSSGGASEFFTETSVGVPKIGTIYISLENNYVGVAYIPTIITTVKIAKIPNTALPQNSILISNDISNFPATIISPTGIPSQLRSFQPNGESGAILNSGVSLWGQGYPDFSKLFLYDANLVKVTEITWPYRNTLRDPISSNLTDTFYVAAQRKITVISSAGVFGPTVWTVPGSGYIYFVSPSLVNNDIIYVKTNTGIGKFHKSTEILDAAFLPIEIGVGPLYSMDGYYGHEFLVMLDDSIVTLYSPTYLNPDKRGKIVHYGPTGSVIKEIMADFEDVNRIHHGRSTTRAISDTIWLWSYDENFNSQFIEFNLTSGARLHEFTLGTTSSGSDISWDGTPISLFGVPESCPLIITPMPLSAYGPGGGEPSPGPAAPDGIYFINPTKATKHDSYYTAIEKKIPDPTIKTALLGE